MHADKKTAFYYHGDASVLGGVLRQPVERTLSTAASVSLAQAGGFHTSRVNRFESDTVYFHSKLATSGSREASTRKMAAGGRPQLRPSRGLIFLTLLKRTPSSRRSR